tara:strand:- start:385 stop:738 length:354 start_codon:yes stop_codon:yes gene_type:complete
VLYEIAGAIGLDPGPLTMRQIYDMWHGNQRNAWDHTAFSAAILANCHRAKNAKAFSFEAFHPIRRGRGRGGTSLTRESLQLMAKANKAKRHASDNKNKEATHTAGKDGEENGSVEAS